MPDVSVLTPSLGYGHFIEDAIASVIGQGGDQIEHLIQDGASSDNTVGVLRRCSSVVKWRSEPDRGQSDALNRAFGRSKGRWIAWLNADEFYFPEALTFLVQEGERRKADIVFGDAVFVDGAGHFLRVVPQHRFTKHVLRHYGPFISSCAVVIRREVLGEFPWDVELRRVMDWDLYLRLSQQNRRFAYVPYPVGAFRIHPARVTRSRAPWRGGENAVVRRRYEIRPGVGRAAIARVQHILLKIAHGSYRRQLAAVGLRGQDLRWFKKAVGLEGFHKLLRASYWSDARRPTFTANPPPRAN